jgi:hypothetical protein
MGSTDEKSQRRKISHYCSFKKDSLIPNGKVPSLSISNLFERICLLSANYM